MLKQLARFERLWEFTGDVVNSKDEAKLHSISHDSSSALIICVRNLCAATTLQQKELTVRGIYDIAAQLYGLNAEVFGAVPFQLP